jgi:hypothetical protein
VQQSTAQRSSTLASSGLHDVTPGDVTLGDVTLGDQVGEHRVRIASSARHVWSTAAAGSQTDLPDCQFEFTVADVPAGESFYGVKIGELSKQVPGADIEAPTLDFGS